MSYSIVAYKCESCFFQFICIFELEMLSLIFVDGFSSYIICHLFTFIVLSYTMFWWCKYTTLMLRCVNKKLGDSPIKATRTTLPNVLAHQEQNAKKIYCPSFYSSRSTIRNCIIQSARASSIVEWCNRWLPFRWKHLDLFHTVLK